MVLFISIVFGIIKYKLQACDEFISLNKAKMKVKTYVSNWHL